MKTRFAFAVLLALAVLVNVGAHAAAQYLYLDADGDGVNSPSEWPSQADTTTVDVYAVTDRNLDGSPAGCNAGTDSYELWYYTLNLLGQEAAFTVISVENRVPGMTELFPPFTNTQGVTVGYSGN